VGLEDAEEGRPPLVGEEAAEEPGVGDEASPVRADRGGAQQGGWLRREAEEDLPEHVLVERQGFGIRRRFAAAATAAAGHPVAIRARVDLGMEARAPAEGHAGYLLTGADLGMEARAATAGNLLRPPPPRLEEWKGRKSQVRSWWTNALTVRNNEYYCYMLKTRFLKFAIVMNTSTPYMLVIPPPKNSRV
jgi:hypothetical protein